jgi:hypothetical protein
MAVEDDCDVVVPTHSRLPVPSQVSHSSLSKLLP